jgi:hypothetical protein
MVLDAYYQDQREHLNSSHAWHEHDCPRWSYQ